VARRDAR